MKAIMVMFDSLNRRLMQPYGGDWVHTPNFARLAGRAVTFDNAFIGSMPCMPARRELHTGRYNFLHRSWGPLEPFDDSMPQLLDDNGVHSHLVTDHQHYWEDGGATYHTRFTTHEFNRGQEGDPWKGLVEAGVARDDNRYFRTRLQDQVNRRYLDQESLMPQAQTFAKGIEFMRANAAADDWYLQIETFDPHEPFFTQPGWKEQYPHEYAGDIGDWPPYARVSESAEDIQHMRYEYAALMTMCDHYLGTGARYYGRAEFVGRHHAHRQHRPWLFAGRARLVGQDAHALVQRAGQYPALRLGSAGRHSRRAAQKPGADHRPARDPARVFRCRAAARYAGRALA